MSVTKSGSQETLASALTGPEGGVLCAGRSCPSAALEHLGAWLYLAKEVKVTLIAAKCPSLGPGWLIAWSLVRQKLSAKWPRESHAWISGTLM